MDALEQLCRQHHKHGSSNAADTALCGLRKRTDEPIGCVILAPLKGIQVMFMSCMKPAYCAAGN